MGGEIKATISEANLETKDVILFESLVGNEREYLTKTLKAQMLGKPNDFACTCGSFGKWLSKQFQKITVPQVSSTLVYNLEFLKKKSTLTDLFTKEGDKSKEVEYFKSIVECQPINYENDALDVYALALASKEYVKKEVTFFDKELSRKMTEVYKNKQEEKRVFVERLPFMIDNRSLFKIIKDLCEEFEKKSSLTNEALIKIWSGAVFPDTIDPELHAPMMKDILLADFDKVPLSFYNSL
ncbi:hypothetical protein GINT2_001788 [Glugoides intestinalis]